MPCTHPKRLHETREAALEHVKSLLWRNQVEGHPERSYRLGVYPCDQSPGWHVGHAHGTPPVYHYTFGSKLDAILAADKLRVPSDARRTKRQRQIEPEPLLWFSRNPEWEFSVFKARKEMFGHRYTWRTLNEIVAQGLVRFAVPAVYAKLRWPDYVERNRVPSIERDAMALYGNPTEWLATDEDVPLDVCCRAGDSGVQVFYRGEWVNVADVDEAAYDAYLKDRPDAYAKAEASLWKKVEAAEAANTSKMMLTTDEMLIAADVDHECRRDEGMEVLKKRLKAQRQKAFDKL